MGSFIPEEKTTVTCSNGHKIKIPNFENKKDFVGITRGKKYE